MSPARKTALTAGICYVLTFVSIPTLSLYGAVKDPGYILSAGPDTAAVLGAALEMIVALACIGTAVVLFPVVKRQNESLALGFVGSRVLEAATIYGGIACILSIVTLRQSGAGAEALSTAHGLAILYDRLFLVGQSLVPSVNALLLGSLLYHSRLVPRILPLLGFTGAPLLVASTAVTVFDPSMRVSALTALGALPIALWEFSLGVWLIVKGFKPSSITRDMDR